jgi:hypothetical protein
MDLVVYNPTYQVLICTRCQYAIIPTALGNHLRTAHKDERLSPVEIRSCVSFFAAKPLLLPAQLKETYIPLETRPIQHLAVFHDGMACRLCPEVGRYICQSVKTIRGHLKRVHPDRRRQRLLPTNSVYTEHITASIACQTFYRSGLRRFFQVSIQGVMREPLETPAQTAISLQDQLSLQLDQKLNALQPSMNSSMQGERHASQVSPWLDLTKWDKCLRGHDYTQAAQLIQLPALPASGDEATLDALLQSYTVVRLEFDPAASICGLAWH